MTQSGLEWGFGDGLLKDKFVLFEACKSPIPKMRTLLAKLPFLYRQKGRCLKRPLNWTGSAFPLLILWSSKLLPNYFEKGPVL